MQTHHTSIALLLINRYYQESAFVCIVIERKHQVARHSYAFLCQTLLVDMQRLFASVFFVLCCAQAAGARAVGDGEYVFAEYNPFLGDPAAFDKGKDLFKRGLLSEAALALEAEVGAGLA